VEDREEAILRSPRLEQKCGLEKFEEKEEGNARVFIYLELAGRSDGGYLPVHYRCDGALESRDQQTVFLAK
jgi:hypothetical protein